MIGKTLNHYKVVACLGKGGMGEVYAAEDTKLGRKVALKILPAEMAANPERRARFEREAKAVAALNHPNIVTIHSVEEADGLHFLTMELVQGKSLSELIPPHGLALTPLLDRAITMADAVSAAHKLGITHRDLKPDNIMIADDGRLKVLDFGLAKLREDAPDAAAATSLPTRSVTQEGKILGTVAYMSPEQAEGKTVDARSDVFSMGIVLYEMATGRRPFQGDTAISTLSAILKETPTSITDLNQALPRHLSRVVGYCLAKEPDGRYQSALELRRELEGLREESASGELQAPVVAAAPAKRGSTKWIGLGLGAIALLVAVFGVMRLLPDRGTTTGTASGGAAAANMEMDLLTSTGYTAEAAISPDANYVTFVERPPALGHSVWVSHVGTGSKVQVVEPSMTFFMWDPTFSPQSDYVYYIGVEQGEQPALYRVPVLGGTPRKVADNVGQRVSFSPEGNRFVFTREDVGTAALVISNLDGSGQRVIATRNFPEDFNDPSWSPDGTMIAAAASTVVGGPQANIALIPIGGGEERLLLPAGWGTIGEVGWLADGSGLVLDGADEWGFFHEQIWEVSYPEGVPRRITNDLNMYNGVSVDASGRNLVTARVEILFDLWLFTPDGSAAPAQLTHTTGAKEGMGLGWTPDGRIVFGSAVGNEMHLEVIDADGGNRQKITSSGINGGPRVTSDGEWMVFASNRAGTVNVWRSKPDGSEPVQLTRGALDTEPSLSPDGRWVAFVGGDGRNVMRVAIEGGEATRINDRNSQSPVVSPDGTRIAVQTWDEAAKRWGFDVIPFDGGEPIHRLDIPGGSELQWSPDGESLTISVDGGGTDNLFVYPLDGGEPRKLTDFDEPFVGAFAWSPDGKRIAIARGSFSSDVVLLRNIR